MPKTNEEIAAEELAAKTKADEESSLLEKYSALQTELLTLKQNLAKQMPTEEKKEEEKEKPDENTIKYAEMLKKNMGNMYVKDWDKLKIADRIQKMETIMEFNNQTKDATKDKHVKESKAPIGTPEKNEEKKDIYYGQNYKKLHNEIFNIK